MDAVLQELQGRFGSAVRIVARDALSGGSICDAALLKLSTGEKVFVKSAPRRLREMFRAEVDGLKALQTPDGPRVPVPLAICDDDQQSYLLMEYIPEGSKDLSWAEKFGRALAVLHRNIRNKLAGFTENNFIGATEQRNPREESWREFFRDHRIGFQTALAGRAGLLSSSDVRDLEKLMEKLSGLLVEPEGDMSLIHGDLWSGNALAGPRSEPVLIDPAVHYGHREADLAMTELFGRFPDRFYRAYDEAWPLDPGYRERRDLYNLYHLLNHLNLFGGGYRSSAMSIVKRFV